jgi:membrane protein implicated in regulation of membrane protease activity
MVVALMAALTAFVPFETLATACLLVCVFLFILDPVPPITRLVALLSVFVVAVLARFHNTLKEERKKEEEKNKSRSGMSSTSSSRDRTSVDVVAMRRKNKEE